MASKKFTNRLLAPLYALVPWALFMNQPAMLPQDMQTIQVGIAKTDCARPEKIFKATIARSPETMSRGLGKRSVPLRKDEAMLFLFNQPKIASFWMKDVSFPIQIGFFSPLGKLVKKHDMPVEKDPARPTRTYSSEKSSMTALEVAPGALDGFEEDKALLCLEAPAKK